MGVQLHEHGVRDAGRVVAATCVPLALPGNCSALARACEVRFARLLTCSTVDLVMLAARTSCEEQVLRFG